MTARKINPVSDPRTMRRVIAEDPEWNLETVLPLVDVCINHIVNNFHKRPLLQELNSVHREKVLAKLPTNIPLKISAPLISDENYWERCCRNRWILCDITEYGQSWKTMYFEKNAEETIETFVPEGSNLSELEELLSISSQFIRCLIIQQLLPPLQDKPISMDEDDNDGVTVDSALKPYNDHLDFNIVLKNLCQLKELVITYGVQNCGMNFQWNLFEFTATDCKLLSKALKATPTLQVFRLKESKVDNERGRVLIVHLLDHASLRILDLSHNCLGDATGRALGKLLNEHSPKLTVLNVSNNRLEEGSGISIGHALQKNNTLEELDISMNRLGDQGVQPILKALMKNKGLHTLNISSNDVGEPSAPVLAEMLMSNSHLTRLNVTCNQFGDAGGKLIQEGMEDNKRLIHFDLRLTGISQESEYCINQMVKTNLDASDYKGVVC